MMKVGFVYRLCILCGSVPSAYLGLHFWVGLESLLVTFVAGTPDPSPITLLRGALGFRDDFVRRENGSDRSPCPVARDDQGRLSARGRSPREISPGK